MQFAVDFHIHSGLSPCADDDMTPNNIVNMALLKGLDTIAVTDHNTAQNLPTVLEVAKQCGLMVIPGVEVQTKEEVHMLCLFRELDAAVSFGRSIYESLPDIKNNPGVFGSQFIFDAEDNIIGSEEKLLLSSSSMSIDAVCGLAGESGGICIPAHVDRSGYSIITNLGFIPPELNFRTVEISKAKPVDEVISKFPFLKGYNHIVSSDAHHLWDISEREFFIELEYLSINKIFEALGRTTQ